MMDLSKIPISDVQGIGTQKAAVLNEVGIRSVLDLIEYFPFRYEDYRLRDLAEVKDGDKVTVQGTLYSEPHVQMLGRKKSRMLCKVKVDPFLVSAVWFNRHFLKDRLRSGEEIILTGKWDQRRLQITVSEHEFPGKGSNQSGTLQPVYSLSGPVTQKWLRSVIQHAITQYGANVPEILPPALQQRYDLMPRKQAIVHIHHPGDMDEGRKARKRMVYEELFLFQLKLQAFRMLNRTKADGIAFRIDVQKVADFVRTLPFNLTDGQKKGVREILKDMSAPFAMNRLLQGDVGSGKTAVAAIALYAAVQAGHQGAFMVPTEILAEQHVRSLSTLMAPFNIEVSLLTGSMREKEKKEVRSALQMGMVHIVIGTHALIQEDVYFRSLGLVVTDEQHRFGVNQRSILRRKGMNPDVLSMTATPIPRTLAITAFGDLDISTIKERPKGRKEIRTYFVKHDMLERILQFIDKEVQQGRQAYVICPLIEESDKLDVQNAVELYEQLQQALPAWRIGLLHGRLHSDEKDEVMRAFSHNEVQVLVSTTVVEVGVDVPNATLMVIYDADRFGLSQLHQLRGRVGRGEHQSHCILIADPRSAIGKERLQVMTETNDGFEIARRDLELRGPGDFFGTKQSGLPEFRIADISSDFEVLEMARDDAADLVAQSDFWTAAMYAPLRNYLEREQVFQSEVLD
jgi:ATP-dependent DNA helicase RecG